MERGGNQKDRHVHCPWLGYPCLKFVSVLVSFFCASPQPSCIPMPSWLCCSAAGEEEALIISETYHLNYLFVLLKKTNLTLTFTVEKKNRFVISLLLLW